MREDRTTNRPDSSLRIALFTFWILSGLFVAAFHEPWRDEAQAWLVARHSTSLWDLFTRASLEASGPVYYLLLWPWAKAFPGAFPSAIFWVSWTGTCLAVALLLFTELVPLSVAALVAFGYLFGYEYAAIARLYGWGSFFLLLGILGDKRDRPLPALLGLSLAAATQLNFLIATMAWCTYRLLEGKKIWRYLPVAFVAVLAVLQLQMAADLRLWQEWLTSTSFTRVGATLIAPFVQTPGPIGWVGLILFPLVLLPLTPKARVALLTGLIPFCALFLFRYTGMAWSRHGGALFLVWICLVGATAATSVRYRRRAVYAILGLSLLTGILGRVQEIGRRYSDGVPAAEAIRAAMGSDRRGIKLITVDQIVSLVTAARLDADLWHPDRKMECPFFAGDCRNPSPREPTECGENEACFFVGRKPAEAAQYLPEWKGSWELVHSPTKTLSHEDIAVMRFSPAPPAWPRQASARDFLGPTP